MIDTEHVKCDTCTAPEPMELDASDEASRGWPTVDIETNPYKGQHWQMQSFRSWNNHKTTDEFRSGHGLRSACRFCDRTIRRHIPHPDGKTFPVHILHIAEAKPHS